MSAQLFFLPFNTLYTSRGLPAGGGKVYFYYTGTTSLAPVYADAGFTTQLPNPVPTDGLGVLPAIYLDGATVYRVVPQDVNGASFGPPIDPYVPGVSADTAAAASAGAAAASASAAAATAAGIAGQAATATAAAATATAAAATATAASMSSGDFWPNSAASNVPRGLTQASVGAITAGSGGTNGTFALAWSGGNFSINPTGTFTVAGGVLTAVTITIPNGSPGSGLYIGASPTVPTPSFAASSGLTGAAVALTAQYLVANGANYWVQSSDGKQLLAYTNSGGTATAVANLGPIPLDIVAQSAAAAASATAAAGSATAAAASAASAQSFSLSSYASSVKSAVGTGSLKALFDMDGPRTAYSGSPTILTALTSLDDTPLTLSVYSSIYAGTDPRPYYDARGIYMGAQAGLQTTAPIFSKTSGDFGFMMALDLNTVTSTVALQSSLPGSPADGDMVLVNGDRNVVTGYGTDVKTVLDTSWIQADLVNGYHKWNSSAAVFERSFYLFKATGPSGSRFECSINHLGQLLVFIYDGTNQVTLLSKGNVLMGQSKCLVAFRRRGNTIYIIVNGKTLYGIGNTSLPNITDLNQWYFNGSGRTANTVQPINNGLRHYVKGIIAADDLTVDCFRDLHDIVAKRHGTPAIVRPRAARGVIVFGQSWTDGTTAVSDLWRAGPNNWDGQVRANNATYAQEANSVTREAFPNVFAHRGRDNPWDIAPYAVQVDPSGNLASASSHDLDVSGENFVAGMAKQLNAHPQGAVTDWIVSGFGSGGATIATLSFQSVVPLVQQLKTVTLTNSDYYNKVLREIVYARDFAYSKGQTYSVDAFVWQQGHSDANNASYLTALYALYDRFVTDIQAITGQGHKPEWFSPQINYSGDGVVNSCNSGSGVIDQLFVDMEEGGRGTRPMYCVGPMYQITNFIHPYRAGHRWIGELFGRAITRILFDGESYGSLHPYAYTYSIGGTTIDIDYRVRSGRALTLSTTNDNNIYQVATNQGFDFTDASAGGVTISSVAATSATRIRVTLTGGTIGAGDTIRYVGSQRFGNVSDGAKVDGLYYDQDWTATFVTNEPPFGNGNLNDLRQWACASRKVL